jgi:hypothetical protein
MSETNGTGKKAKAVNKYVKTFRAGAVAANVFARQASGGFEYFDFSLSRAWKSANGKEGYSQGFFAANREALKEVVDQACDFIDEDACSLRMVANEPPVQSQDVSKKSAPAS